MTATLSEGVLVRREGIWTICDLAPSLDKSLQFEGTERPRESGATAGGFVSTPGEFR